MDYAYDSVGNLVSIQQGENLLVEDIEYAPSQKLEAIQYGNGVESVFEYDLNKQYRLVRKQSTLPGGSPAALQNIFYTYDKVGNITNLTETGGTIAARNINYTYDDLYRLTEVDNTTIGEIRDYEYDEVGNIIFKSDQGRYTYDQPGKTNPQAVTEIINDEVFRKRFTYDENGNLIRKEVEKEGEIVITEYEWDHYNRMIASRVSDESGVVRTTYTYNSAGIRLKKTVDDGTTSYTTLYPFSDYELTQASTEKISVSAGNSLVAVIESDSTSSHIYFHHNDHLGGSNIVTDATGAIAQVIDYHPFGETRLESQAGSYDSTQKFTGHELDDSTNLYYAKARYYDPLIGRFISQDPLQYRVGELIKKFATKPQGFGMYTYVMNNPILFVDPEGEETKVYIERGKIDDGFEAVGGHAFIEVARGGDRTIYSWGGNTEGSLDLLIEDAETFLAREGKNADAYEVYTFQTSKLQEENINDYYKDLLTKNDHTSRSTDNDYVGFGLFSYNCVDVTLEAMKVGGIINNDIDMIGPDRPAGLRRILDDAHQWQQNLSDLNYLFWWEDDYSHIMHIDSKEYIETGK